MSTKKTEFLSGKLYWAKILGDPVPNYDKNGKEWTFEFEPDEAGIEVIEKHKLADRLKTNKEGRKPYLILRQKELNYEGKENKPIRVYDEDDTEWDRSILIGNASGADVKLDIRDYGVGKKKGIYPVAIRVTDLIEYQSSEFGGMDKGNDAAPKKAPAKAPKRGFAEDLDDDLPF